MDFAPVQLSTTQELPQSPPDLVPLVESKPDPTVSKNAIRTSLRASTFDGVFATIFSNITGGVLLSNFLVELNASPVEIGMLASIPMLANLIQPVGAYFADRTNSRHWYCLWIYGPARLLWVGLVIGLAIASWHPIPPAALVKLTLSIVFLSHFLGALGSASWLSWLASLVPRRLRGRYFGIRNSAASLTNLLSVPLLGLFISLWHGGALQGYGVILVFGIITGLISLGFQFWMVDINPQIQHTQGSPDVSPDVTVLPESDMPLEAIAEEKGAVESTKQPIFQDFNFLRFLLYLGGWTFAVNVSAPFFNLYLLDNLALDVGAVTLYNSLSSGAYLVLLILWGKVADRIGNRPILISVGILVALTPLLWLGTGSDLLSVWIWLPFLHILGGGTWAAIDLCSNNMQLGVVPNRNQATYFGIAAAIAGVSGALGTTAGGFLAQFSDYGGLPGLFALSGGFRLLALLPLVFVHEQRGQSLRQMTRLLFAAKED